MFFVHIYELTSVERSELDARRIRVVDGRVMRLMIENDTCSAVFVRPANSPHADGLLPGLGCELDSAGFVTVDGTGQTSVDGVWAAGNVVDPRGQVITAAGAGSAAAIAINADLVLDDVSHAMGREVDHTGVSTGRPLTSSVDVGIVSATKSGQAGKY